MESDINKKIISNKTILLIFYFCLALPSPARADCWGDAEKRYAVSRFLLLAIALHESGLNSSAISKNSNGTYDIGLMQINSTWLPQLKKYGIGPHELLNPCINLNIGAWILALNFNTYGKNWRAIGAYNAKTDSKRKAYANQVALQLKKVALQYGINQ